MIRRDRRYFVYDIGQASFGIRHYFSIPCCCFLRLPRLTIISLKKITLMIIASVAMSAIAIDKMIWCQIKKNTIRFFFHWMEIDTEICLRMAKWWNQHTQRECFGNTKMLVVFVLFLVSKHFYHVPLLVLWFSCELLLSVLFNRMTEANWIREAERHHIISRQPFFPLFVHSLL